MQTSPRNERAARRMLDYLARFIGLPYKWGGNDPMEGWDCSNLAAEGLRSQGLLPPKTYLNSDALYARLKTQGKAVDAPAPGVLVFFGKTPAGGRLDITHVAVCWDEEVMIEASDGGPGVTGPDEASRWNAFVKMRPIDRRSDRAGFMDPFKE